MWEECSGSFLEPVWYCDNCCFLKYFSLENVLK
jgi:hypothetical protein